MKFKIGSGSSIHIGTKFNCAKNLEIGINCTINQYCCLDNRGGIFIKDNVSISPHVKIITADHFINSTEFLGRNRPVYIETNVYIGFDALILGNTTLGEGSIIGARSLVTKDTDPFGVYFGIPCTKRGERNNELLYNASYKRWFL